MSFFHHSHEFWKISFFSILFLQVRNFKKHKEKALPSKTLIGFGNPLLDISATVENDFLHKYGLKKNTAILAEERHKLLFKELIENYKVDYSAGGSVQNSLRACQWVLQKPHTAVFFGCVGDDEYSKILHQKASDEGVVVRYQCVSSPATGRCAALITGTDRSLIADLGAAEFFTLDYLTEMENWCLIENAKYFYTSGFFLVVNAESVMKVAQHAEKCNCCFSFNLSAVYVSELFMPKLQEVMPFVDILIGNGQEVESFAKYAGWGITDRKEIGRRLQCYDKRNCKRPRLVIITQDKLPVLLIQQDSVQEFEVPIIPKENLEDTNGAGDGFVGGFLAQYMLGESVEDCIRCGIYVAQHTISNSGVRFKGKPNFLI